MELVPLVRVRELLSESIWENMGMCPHDRLHGKPSRCRRIQLIDRACHCHQFEINWVSNTSALLLFIQYDDNTIREFQIKVTLLSTIFMP